MQKYVATHQSLPPIRWSIFVAAIFLTTALPLAAQTNTLTDEIRLLREENALLQKQVRQQGEQIGDLIQKVGSLESTRVIEGGNDKPLLDSKSGLNKFNLGLEGGVGYAATGPDGSIPDGKFRVDEGRIFLEAPLWDDVYFFGELVLATAEQQSYDSSVELGEFYAEFENISKLWKEDSQLNARLGQMYIPFGEEYISRNAIDNPLITHSIVDFWGVTPGVEIYGDLGKFTYVAAAQNGADGEASPSGEIAVAGRIGYDPNEHWHFSVSGMSSGEVKADDFSAMWFGNGFFHSIGSASTTRFHAEALQGDLTRRWKSGHLGANLGWAHYGDNDSAGRNTRDVYYYSAELVQNLPKKFFVATRWSQVFCENGIPIVGYGESSDYSASLTTALWRLSLGLGYKFSDRLVLKAEYSFEQGREWGGDKRKHENFFGTEAAFKF